MNLQQDVKLAALDARIDCVVDQLHNRVY